MRPRAGGRSVGPSVVRLRSSSRLGISSALTIAAPQFPETAGTSARPPRALPLLPLTLTLENRRSPRASLAEGGTLIFWACSVPGWVQARLARHFHLLMTRGCGSEGGP